jgi:TonB-dependent SusC/RagA subfamily outer membrane receptor
MKKIFAFVFGALFMAPGVVSAQELDASIDGVNQNNAEVNLRYDIQDQLGLTGAVSTIKASELDNEYTDALTAVLAGKLAGLATIADGGTAGGATLYVRGINSPNHSGPIVYVDGLRSSIANITLAEIDTISILKDAGALSIFGHEGASGVIYITTKRGKIGKTKVNVNFRQGFQQVTELPDFVDSYTYASLYNEALSNDKGAWTQYYTEEQLAAYKNGNDGTIENYDLLYPNVNWYDEVLRDFAPVTTADATFSGRNNNLRYFASMGYQGVEGLYAGTDKKRNINSNVDDQKFNFRINLDANLGKIFDLKAGIAGTIRHQYRPNTETSTLWTMMNTIPANAMPVKTPDGYGGNVLYQSNPVAEVLETGYYDNHNRVVDANFTLGQNLDFLLKGLRLEESIALNSTHQQVTMKKKSYQTFEPFMGAEGI